MTCRKTVAALLLLAALLSFACAALAESGAVALAPNLRGYSKDDNDYQYVTFGEYPFERDGTTAPVLWRVLGPGTPEAEDIGHAADSELDKVPRDNVRGDALEGENADLFCLMTQYIVDVALYHGERDVPDGKPLDYEDSAVRAHLIAQVLPALFTPEEQAALEQMPGRGLISLPSRRGELHRPDYGFVAADFAKPPLRRATGTPYAYEQGLQHTSRFSWYYTTDWRRCGYRWIVGDDGHISVAAADRVGGVRLVCYLHEKRVRVTGGSGTMEDPYRLESVKTAQ